MAAALDYSLFPFGARLPLQRPRGELCRASRRRAHLFGRDEVGGWVGEASGEGDQVAHQHALLAQRPKFRDKLAHRIAQLPQAGLEELPHRHGHRGLRGGEAAEERVVRGRRAIRERAEGGDASEAAVTCDRNLAGLQPSLGHLELCTIEDGLQLGAVK